MPKYVPIGQTIAEIWTIFKIVAVCRLVFSKIHFTCRLPRYARFSIFQYGGRLPSSIFKSGKFYLPSCFGEPLCFTMPNFLPIG